MVEQIEEFRAELHRHTFGEMGPFDEGHVPVIRARSAYQIAAGAPETAERRIRERAGAEPAGQLLVNGKSGQSGRAAVRRRNARAVGGDAHVQRRPGFKSRNT